MASRTESPSVSAARPAAAGSSGYVALVLALVAVWGIGDVVSTLLAVAATGTVAFEANPLVRAVLARSPLFLVVFKAAVVLVVGLALLRWGPAVRRTPYWRSWLSVVLAAGVVVVAANLSVAVSALV